MSRAGSSTAAAVPDAKRLRLSDQLGRTIAAQPRTTRAATVRTLVSLHEAGLLVGDISERRLATDLARATRTHATTQTPYGPLIQKVRLDHHRMKYWEVCNPMAFIWLVTSLSPAFSQIMRDVVGDGSTPLRLVIYADEMNPGNPFRPEKSRTMQCIYWCFADWPQWMLTRTFAWPCLSVLRGDIVDGIEGGMSFLVKPILRLFFPEGGEHSFARGVQVVHADGPVMTKAIFAGFLCDLKGHKDNTGWLGYNGTVCCLDCENLRLNLRGEHDTAIGLDCWDRDRFIRRTNADVWAIVDRLRDARPAMGNTEFKKLESELGFHWVPHGIIADLTLRDIYKPLDHTIRDWMHTLVGDGQANSTIGETLRVIKNHGFATEHVQEFLMHCKLPHKHGKPHAAWLKSSRVKPHTLSSFSSIILSVVPIMYLFLEEFCIHVDELSDVRDCFRNLHYILGILKTGPEDAMRFIDVLRDHMQLHYKQLCALYTKCKPKLHHMHHIVDGMLYVGKLLSCFVTERKHKCVKDIALHVFRSFEHTVIHDVVNQQMEQLITGVDIYRDRFLVRPSVLADSNVRQSTTAVFRCGELTRGDLVMLRDSSCGRVTAFYEVDGSILVRADVFAMVDKTASIYAEERFVSKLLTADEIVDAVVYFYQSPATIKVCVPPQMFL